MGLEETAK